jgi:hypothetical protein
MVELSLREEGWRAESYGCGNPAATLCAAIEERRPKLFWLSVSAFESAEAFLEDYQKLYQAATAAGAAIAVGGRGLTEGVRREMRYSVFCDTLSHLVTFAASISRSSTPAASAESAT